MTSQLLGDVAVRQATLDDKAAVLAINEDIADGRDYLPALYDYCITSPNAQMFVLLLKDKIVSAPYEPRSEKIGLRGFRPGLTQTGLYRHIKHGKHYNETACIVLNNVLFVSYIMCIICPILSVYVCLKTICITFYDIYVICI